MEDMKTLTEKEMDTLFHGDCAMLHIRLEDGKLQVTTLAPGRTEAVGFAQLAAVLLEDYLDDIDTDFEDMETVGNA